MAWIGLSCLDNQKDIPVEYYEDFPFTGSSLICEGIDFMNTLHMW